MEGGNLVKPANCKNCGAPLNDSGVCEYCGASHKPAARHGKAEKAFFLIFFMIFALVFTMLFSCKCSIRRREDRMNDMIEGFLSGVQEQRNNRAGGFVIKTDSGRTYSCIAEAE